MFICPPGDYMGVNNVYEDILDLNSLKKLMGEKLEDYNETPGMVTMDLVLFRDAIEHSKLLFYLDGGLVWCLYMY